MERIGCGKMNDLMKCTALDRERGANAAVRGGLKKKKAKGSGISRSLQIHNRAGLNVI